MNCRVKPKVMAISLNPSRDILSSILRKHGVNTLLEFVLHTNPKCSTARETKRYVLIMNVGFLHYMFKISAIRDAKLNHLVGFKMHEIVM